MNLKYNKDYLFIIFIFGLECLTSGWKTIFWYPLQNCTFMLQYYTFVLRYGTFVLRYCTFVLRYCTFVIPYAYLYCDIAHVISDIVHLYYSVADWTVCSSVNGSACEHKCDKVKIHFIIFF